MLVEDVSSVSDIIIVVVAVVISHLYAGYLQLHT